jgi:hypothetical protein
MRIKIICTAMIISGMLVACGGNAAETKSAENTSGAVTMEKYADSTQKGVQSKVKKYRVISESSKMVETTKESTVAETTTATTQAETTIAETTKAQTTQASEQTSKQTEQTEAKKENVSENKEAGEIGLNPEWQYASFSKINSGKSVLYKAGENAKGITIAVNAGHGTKGGSSQKTLCHPDGSAKVTSGTTKAGATTAIAVSEGMTFADGTPESTVTFEMAKVLKDELLSRGYNVLMIRNDTDVQLDNIARTVIANNNSNAHIALHWDSTTADKGAFYMGVPEVDSYRNMQPVASNWEKHEALGKALINGLSANGTKIFSNGRMAMDLTQTSYSTIPSIDIELGDKTSNHGKDELKRLSKGIADGLDIYFGK